MVKNKLPEENLGLCIEGCSVDNDVEPDSSDDEEREGFFGSILQDSRFTDEKDFILKRAT
jgi:hypothetical protein